MFQFFRNEKYIKQELISESSSEEAISSESDMGQDEDAATAGCDNNANGSQVHILSRPQHRWNSDVPI
jgi:hypothetical protein